MPPQQEALARQFYTGVLEIPEVLKPIALASRGGVWFEEGALRVHLGVDAEFRPARKAHPGFLVTNLDALKNKLKISNHPYEEDNSLEDYARIFVKDPFGNRLEFMQAKSANEI